MGPSARDVHQDELGLLEDRESGYYDLNEG